MIKATKGFTHDPFKAILLERQEPPLETWNAIVYVLDLDIIVPAILYTDKEMGFIALWWEDRNTIREELGINILPGKDYIILVEGSNV